jgi:hypothetical protein
VNAIRRGAGASRARAVPAPRPAASKPRGGGGKRGVRVSPRLALWGKVALLVGLVMLGLPMAHALAGEVVALLGGAVLFGFLLGRWTAPGR